MPATLPVDAQRLNASVDDNVCMIGRVRPPHVRNCRKSLQSKSAQPGREP